MRRRRITEMLPFLLPFRKWQRNLFFYIKMYFDGNKYSRDKVKEKLKYEIYKTDSQMINEKSGFEIKYQLNKVHNLKLASSTMDHLVINPNEVFSFWQLVRYADRDVAYKEGLNLVNGKIVGSYGGGLCQLSNMLFWMFLHTPLTIIERHSHNVQNFAPASGEPVVGIDATISEGWKDLKVKNETQNTYQIIISFDEEYMYGVILSDSKPNISYRIFNKEVSYYKENDNVVEIASVNRQETNKDTKEDKEILLYENKTKINYELDKKINH